MGIKNNNTLVLTLTTGKKELANVNPLLKKMRVDESLMSAAPLALTKVRGKY
jgi:hypothetical protein